MKKYISILLFILVLAITGCSGSSSDDVSGNKEKEEKTNANNDYPDKAIETVVAASAGGGLDLMARSIDKGLKEADLLDQPLVIRNMEGGGGNTARAFLAEQDGNPNYILIESNRVFMNNLIGNTELSLDDVTPLARMATEYLAWVVKEDSEFTDAIQILEKLKKDPHSVQFGVDSLPSNDQINIIGPAKEFGIDPKEIEIVVYGGGGDLMTQLLGGHIDVIITGVSEAIEQVKAGKGRMLTVSSPEPLEGELADIPTWNSLGIDVEILHWRGVFGPPNMPENAVTYWDKQFQALVESKEWQEILEQNSWFDAYADSATFKEELEEEKENMSELLNEVGLSK